MGWQPGQSYSQDLRDLTAVGLGRAVFPISHRLRSGLFARLLLRGLRSTYLTPFQLERVGTMLSPAPAQ